MKVTFGCRNEPRSGVLGHEKNLALKSQGRVNGSDVYPLSFRRAGEPAGEYETAVLPKHEIPFQVPFTS